MACRNWLSMPKTVTPLVANGCFVQRGMVEAKYMATNHNTKEAIWLILFMARLGCAQGEVTRIICDNQWSISFPKNSSHNACKQYINVHYHFILDKLEIGIIQLDYWRTWWWMCSQTVLHNRLKRAVITFDWKTLVLCKLGVIKLMM